MKKEVSIAIVIGILLGAIILYGINLANTSTKNLPKLNPFPTSAPLNADPANSTSSSSATLNITSHTPNQVVFDKEIILTGKGAPKTTIALIWEDDEIILVTDDKGNFSQKITLLAGENTLRLDELTSNNSLKSQSLKLYFSPKPLE